MKPDTRRVCDLNAAEIAEAFVARCQPYGWARGRWEITLSYQDGHLLRARVPALVMEGRISWATVGRGQLANVESRAAA